ncbi:unnamed protein product [Pleuronectes platessa]|uniref:Uncharacterized protein n=1 Tax=Pleuronectes platessa TaxID=8262 RepID=A0A9N7Y9Y2_PLEPL|nr:unnamed protein product [Pleuronectes platessa]
MPPQDLWLPPHTCLSRPGPGHRAHPGGLIEIVLEKGNGAFAAISDRMRARERCGARDTAERTTVQRKRPCDGSESSIVGNGGTFLRGRNHFMAGHSGLSEHCASLHPSLLSSLPPRTFYAGLRTDAFDCTAPHQGQLIKNLILGEAGEGNKFGEAISSGNLWIR